MGPDALFCTSLSGGILSLRRIDNFLKVVSGLTVVGLGNVLKMYCPISAVSCTYGKNIITPIYMRIIESALRREQPKSQNSEIKALMNI